MIMKAEITKVHKDGSIDVSAKCECGSPITHATSSGMHCSNPNCNLEKENDRLEKKFNKLFNALESIFG